MAGPDELDYLHRGFDLTTLTVAVLRRILVTHGVECQQAHRKQDFLKLVREKIVPNRDRIIKYSQQPRTIVGIQNAMTATVTVSMRESNDLYYFRQLNRVYYKS